MATEILSLLVVTFLSTIAQQAFGAGPPTIVENVPGLVPGAYFKVLVRNLSANLKRITLSVEDLNGKSLHIELRYNNTCKITDSPTILFNSKTEGKFDRAIIEQAPFLWDSHYNVWNLTAEETQYKFVDIKSNNLSTTFPYRPGHPLSDIKAIKVYGAGCGPDNFDYDILAKFVYPVPSKFKTITIKNRALDFTFSTTKNRITIQFDSGFLFSYAVYDDDNIMYHNYKSDSKLLRYDSDTPFSLESDYEITIEDISYGSEEVVHSYTVTISVDNNEVISDLFQSDPNDMQNGQLIISFPRTVKLEIIE